MDVSVNNYLVFNLKYLLVINLVFFTTNINLYCILQCDSLRRTFKYYVNYLISVFETHIIGFSHYYYLFF